MIRSFSLIALLLSMSFLCFATEDPEIKIIDSYLGSTKGQIFIYQDVYNYGGYLTNVFVEKWILVKEVKDGRLVLKDKIRIESNKDIARIFELPDFNLAVPDSMQSKYVHLYSSKNDMIYYLGNEYNVNDLIPKELWQYNIDKIECTYRFNNHVLVVLDLVSKTEIEYLRKVVLLK